MATLTLLSQKFPDYLVLKILTRLPVKFLIRFWCISEFWDSTITSTTFITKHFNLNKAKSLLPNNDNSHNFHVLFSKITRLNITVPVRFVGFCNGIVCLVVHVSVIRSLYLWNPSIRQRKMLLVTSLTDPFGCLAYGSGYHFQNNDFKVLRFFRPREKPVGLSIQSKVYSLSTNSLRKVLSSITGIESPSLFFNGALHFIAYSQDHKFILSFDLNEEKFREIILPNNYFELFRKFERLMVFEGSLALITIGKDDELIELWRIWVMREYGVVESWTQKELPLSDVENFFGSGELAIKKTTFSYKLFPFDPESLNENNLMENIVLLK